MAYLLIIGEGRGENKKEQGEPLRKRKTEAIVVDDKRKERALCEVARPGCLEHATAGLEI